MTDYKKLVKALRCENAGDDECGSSDCPYWSGLGCMDGQLMEDAADAIEALQKTLKAVQTNSGINFRMWEEAKAEVERLQAQLSKRGEIVRCGECKHRKDSIQCPLYSEGIKTADDWFCADGEEREVQE